MYYIGCSGWHYRHWLRNFYPDDLEPSQWLEYYSKFFNSVEVNSTFYNWPPEEVFDGWRERVNKDFKYTIKVHNQITHRRKFNETYSFISRFYDLGKRLDGKLGTFLFQLPPSIKKDMEFLERACDQFNVKKYKNVFEFRDASWYDVEVFDFMKKKKVVFCCIDALNYPKHVVSTSDTFYIKLLGKEYRHDYSWDELLEIEKKIKALKRVKDYYIYFDNDYEGNAVKNAKMMQQIFEIKGNKGEEDETGKTSVAGKAEKAKKKRK